MADAVIDSDLWLRRFHRSGSDSTSLVVLPHAGGSASFFRPFSEALSPEFDVLTVQYPGRQDRRSEQRIENISDYADQIHAALRPHAGRPLALYGHSMGAVLAFEVARRLEGSGSTPVAVIASGRRAPSTHRAETVHQRDDDGIVAELRELSGTHANLLADEEIVRMILPALRSDYTAIERYTCPPEHTVSCPILALTGDADERTTIDETDAWRRHTTGRFEREVLAGGHFFIVDHQRRLAELVTDFVRRAGGAG